MRHLLTRTGSAVRVVTATALVAALALTGTAITVNAANATPGPAGTGSTGSVNETGQRGHLLDHVPLRTISASDVRTELVAEGFADADSVAYGISTYRLVYATVDERGRPTTASGLVALPERRAGRVLSTVSYTHGTEIAKTDAPSVSTNPWATGPSHAYAAAGFASVAPDYVGLGVGPGQHPFLHIPSETTATIDLLRAARTFAQQNGRILRRDVYVTGFSQGASAATGIAKALHNGADRSFRLAALAPISGAYDWRRVQLPVLLNGADTPTSIFSVGYSAYFLTSWNRWLHLYDDSSEVFQPPYDDGRIERVLDGTHSGQELLATIPNNVKQLYTPHAFDLMRNPTGRLANAMRTHDSTCSDWTPRVPVRLLYSAADEQVDNANTAYCAAEFRDSGTAVTSTDLGPTVDHLGSNRAGTASTVAWFTALAH